MQCGFGAVYRVIPVILQGLHWGGEAGVGSGLGHCHEGCGLLIVRLNAHLCTSHCSSSRHYLMRCKLTRFLFCMKKTKAECGQALVYCYPTAGEEPRSEPSVWVQSGCSWSLSYTSAQCLQGDTSESNHKHSPKKLNQGSIKVTRPDVRLYGFHKFNSIQV